MVIAPSSFKRPNTPYRDLCSYYRRSMGRIVCDLHEIAADGSGRFQKKRR